MERWFFYQDAAGLWKWARLDIVGTILGHSGGSFETREACVEHARQSGYDAESRAAGIQLGTECAPHAALRPTQI